MEFNKFNLQAVNKQHIITKNIPDPQWIAGFTNGEGNFYVNIYKSTTHKTGYRVQLRFSLTQYDRDLKLIELIKKYLGAWIIEKDIKTSIVRLRISPFSDIKNIIIPLFDKNPLRGVKQLDYLDWYKVSNLMSEGQHLKPEGLNLKFKI
jgi:hypothetical protein